MIRLASDVGIQHPTTEALGVAEWPADAVTHFHEPQDGMEGIREGLRPSGENEIPVARARAKKRSRSVVLRLGLGNMNWNRNRFATVRGSSHAISCKHSACASRQSSQTLRCSRKFCSSTHESWPMAASALSILKSS